MEVYTGVIVCLIASAFHVLNAQTFQDCNVDNFYTQVNFNLTRFSGYWFAISANRVLNLNPRHLQMRMNGMGRGGGMAGFDYGMPGPMGSMWGEAATPRNIQYYFSVGPDGNLTTMSSGTVMGRRCFYAQGKNIPQNESDPGKTDFIFQGRVFPVWVISTDYVGYAVLYSCWGTDAGGNCHPEDSHVITLNRVQAGHTQEELKKVDSISTNLCVPPNELNPIIQDGGCAFDPVTFPHRDLSII